MSTLKELLKKHCPNGVEFKKMSDICKSIKTGKLDANAMEENGKYRFYTCAKEYYKINTYAFDCEALLISGNGANVGYIHYYKGKFNAYQRTYVLTDFTEDILYIKYFLDSRLKERIDKEKKTGNTPYIRLNTLTDMIIPVPPIEVQKEIVRILDEFTEKTTKLQELLHRETVLRKKQYEYYRDKLLTFTDEVEYKTVGDVGLVTKLAGFEFTKYVTYSNEGKIIALRGLNVKNGRLNLDEVKYIDESDLTKLTRSKLYIDDMLFTYVGTIGEVALIDEDDKYYLAPNVALIRFDKKLILPKFMIYYFQSKIFFNTQINKLLQSSSMKNIPMEKIRKFLVPIPPLEEQERIVNILDKFDALCNDITRGLPAEIEMRKKQYEYYRDKLLTFKEKKK